MSPKSSDALQDGDFTSEGSAHIDGLLDAVVDDVIAGRG